MENTNSDEIRMGTKSVWAGEREFRAYGATQIPVVVSVTYEHEDVSKWYEVAMGRQPGYIYSRNSNPTSEALEKKVSILEGSESAVSFSTGMAAISGTLYTLLRPGDRVVSVKDTYGGTNKIFTEFLPQIGVESVLCNTTDDEEIINEITKGCNVLYLETPTNPTCKIIDINKFALIAKKYGSIVVVDNTFATPINQNPIKLGADLVVHSATKFLGGHADAMGGIVCGPKDLIQKIYHYREINGAVLDPWSAYLIIRGIKTLKLRISQQQESALSIAKYLQSKKLVDAVNYPGLETHPGHSIATKQMHGFGAMLSFSIFGGLNSAGILLPKLKYANMAANLGSVETTYGPARTTSHVECTEEERQALGIADGLIRISVGIEDTADLIDDLDQAFEHLESCLDASN